MTGLLSITSVTLPALLHITPTVPSPAGFQEALWSLRCCGCPTKSNNVGVTILLAAFNMWMRYLRMRFWGRYSPGIPVERLLVKSTQKRLLRVPHQPHSSPSLIPSTLRPRHESVCVTSQHWKAASPNAKVIEGPPGRLWLSVDRTNLLSKLTVLDTGLQEEPVLQ